MKKTTIKQNLLVLIFALGAVFSTQAQKTSSEPTAFGKKISASNINPDNGMVRCFTTEYENFLQEQNPKRMSDAQFEAWLQPLLEDYKKGNTTYSQAGGIITIPVVVHVIHNGQPVGVAPNITDSQVESQITVMNNDFRRLAGTPGFNNNPLGADVMVQFALAKVDPNGNPTNGINRVNLCQQSWSTNAIDSTVKPQTIWDANSYLNMWSVKFSDESLLGYAQFPDASGLGGLSNNGGPANTDGVVCNYATFGSINYNDGTFLLSPPYNQGRTMTHEVGHWLGLRHIWGDGACNADDFCADTPNAGQPNFGCPTGIDTCPASPGVDMIENYMDYTDDACMNIFTQNQKDRITVILNNAARRATLKTSTKDVAIPLFANDAEIKIEGNCNSSAICGGPIATTKKVTLYNRGTSPLTTANLSYTVNGGTPAAYTWNGNLAQNKFATFDIPVVSTVAGPIVVNIVNVNGTADQRASNNSATGEFSTGAPQNLNYTTFVFNLQRDYYGSETTWTLKNEAGAILYSGGPYTNTPLSGQLPAVFSQTWTLPANGCYVFQINDLAGDGICCSYGNGFYRIKSSPLAGNLTLISGGEFGETESKSFTNYVLSTQEFTTSGNIFVYPNPTKNLMNISVPAELGLPDSYTIHNTLGQVIKQAAVNSENDLSVNTAAFSQGVYLITIVKDNQSKTLRFIKN